MRHDNFIHPDRFTAIRSRGFLPHWIVNEAVYFVTFSLKDALPAHVIRELFEERQRLQRGVTDSTRRAHLDRALQLRADSELDAGRGSCVLAQHANLVADALKHFDGTRYDLHAWCVMPNHVHAMFYVERGEDVAAILHSWKSYTAHRIGLGPIWQREYFDRIVRGDREFETTRGYVRANPEKARLVDWPWVG
ncbi:MAG TPA: transposase [Thermoanaerobaculia bacterium]